MGIIQNTPRVRVGDRPSAKDINEISEAHRNIISMPHRPKLFRRSIPYVIKNDSGLDIPAYSAVLISSYSDKIYHVVRPDQENIQPGKILFTKEHVVNVGGIDYAYSAFDEPVICNVDTSGSAYGTQANSFILKAGNDGFVHLATGDMGGANTVLMRPFRMKFPDIYTLINATWTFPHWDAGDQNQDWILTKSTTIAWLWLNATSLSSGWRITIALRYYPVDDWWLLEAVLQKTGSYPEYSTEYSIDQTTPTPNGPRHGKGDTWYLNTQHPYTAYDFSWDDIE